MRDAGTSVKDTGTCSRDSGKSVKDSGTSYRDSGTSFRDSGTSFRDSGVSFRENGTSTSNAMEKVRSFDISLGDGLLESNYSPRRSSPEKRSYDSPRSAGHAFATETNSRYVRKCFLKSH